MAASDILDRAIVIKHTNSAKSILTNIVSKFHLLGTLRFSFIVTETFYAIHICPEK